MHKGFRAPLSTAVELQHLLVEKAHSKDCTPAAAAQVARAWCELEERKRILRMKPAPKPNDTTTMKPTRKDTSGPVFTE